MLHLSVSDYLLIGGTVAIWIVAVVVMLIFRKHR